MSTSANTSKRNHSLVALGATVLTSAALFVLVPNIGQADPKPAPPAATSAPAAETSPQDSPNIEVSWPTEGATIHTSTDHTAPVTDKRSITGRARAFEGTVTYQIFQGDTLVDKGFTSTGNGIGWGDFEINPGLGEYETGDYRLVVSDGSAGDGHEAGTTTVNFHIQQG